MPIHYLWRYLPSDARRSIRCISTDRHEPDGQCSRCCAWTCLDSRSVQYRHPHQPCSVRRHRAGLGNVLRASTFWVSGTTTCVDISIVSHALGDLPERYRHVRVRRVPRDLRNGRRLAGDSGRRLVASLRWDPSQRPPPLYRGVRIRSSVWGRRRCPRPRTARSYARCPCKKCRRWVHRRVVASAVACRGCPLYSRPSRPGRSGCFQGCRLSLVITRWRRDSSRGRVVTPNRGYASPGAILSGRRDTPGIGPSRRGGRASPCTRLVPLRRPHTLAVRHRRVILIVVPPPQTATVPSLALSHRHRHVSRSTRPRSVRGYGPCSLSSC